MYKQINSKAVLQELDHCVMEHHAYLGKQIPSHLDGHQDLLADWRIVCSKDGFYLAPASPRTRRIHCNAMVSFFMEELNITRAQATQLYWAKHANKHETVPILREVLTCQYAIQACVAWPGLAAQMKIERHRWMDDWRTVLPDAFQTLPSGRIDAVCKSVIAIVKSTSH